MATRPNRDPLLVWAEAMIHSMSSASNTPEPQRLAADHLAKAHNRRDSFWVSTAAADLGLRVDDVRAVRSKECESGRVIVNDPRETCIRALASR